jgi:hypothetical protein
MPAPAVVMVSSIFVLPPAKYITTVKFCREGGFLTINLLLRSTLFRLAIPPLLT